MADTLKFGTSGLRGLAAELIGAPARQYVAAFLAHLGQTGRLGSGGEVYLGRDLRASSPAIAADCAIAIRAAGLTPVDCGVLPTPALALIAIARAAPAIMVTGSHIPADRNGLKFYRPDGEIDKKDEQGIAAALAEAAPDGEGPAQARDGSAEAGNLYRQRYRHLLPAGTLGRFRIGVYEHSSTQRDILVSLLTRAGADGVVRLGRSDDFVAVDTEAPGDAVFARIPDWIAEHHLDAVVSADGDGDRPLLIDETGAFVRGDALGLMTAQFLGSAAVVTPVTSNSAIEGADGVRLVQRTRVGSPFVIGAMQAVAGRAPVIVGFEANGGVLLGSEAKVGERTLAPLPTRDAVLPILAAFGLAAAQGKTIGQLVAGLGLRAARSDRLTDVPAERSTPLLRRLGADRGFAAQFLKSVGEVESVSTIDGPRFTLASDEVVHWRASGNAPELRCYVEAASPDRADELLRWGLAAAAAAVRGEA
jgi:phosphomannomutase